MNKQDHRLIFRFSMLGILFGLCFPLIAISFDIFYRNLNFNLADIIQVHQQNPIHFIIDSAPLILSLTAFGISKFVQKREKRSRKYLQQELQKNQQLLQITQCILEGKSNSSIENNMLDPETIQSLEMIQCKLDNQQEADRRNQWASQALASVMGILKKMETNWQEELLSLFCRLMESRQGIFWQLSDDKVSMKIKACFALDESSRTEAQIERNQGICGQAWEAGQTQYHDHLPENYLKISSGLGDTQKPFLVIIPLKLDEEVFGLLELASFTKIAEHRVKWLEEVGEQVALKIATLRHERELSHLLKSTQARIDQLEEENARLLQG